MFEKQTKQNVGYGQQLGEVAIWGSLRRDPEGVKEIWEIYFFPIDGREAMKNFYNVWGISEKRGGE